MSLRTIHINGFKSFATDTKIHLYHPVTAIVGPNGSGKSNVADAIRFALGEQSIKSMRGGKGEDLIFNGSAKHPRKNRAHVSLTFDNSKNVFDLDVSEVELQRLVHRDGVNEYLVNSNKTRLKDKLELIATANIGPTGHYMITQGEADKFVTATGTERRLLIEDALGLNLYKLRRHEAEGKLSKTDDKLKEVNKHVWELEPIVKALNTEVDRLESLQQKEKTLIKLYAEMFYLWQRYLSDEGLRLQQKLSDLQERLEELKTERTNLAESASENEQLTPEEIELGTAKKRAQRDLSDWQEQVSLQQNELGQLSGSESQLSSRQSILERKLQSFESRSNISAVSVAVDDINDLKQQVDLAASIMGAKQSVANFYHKCLGNNSSGNNQTDLKSHLQQELAEVTEELQVVLGKKREKEIKLKSLENEVQKAVQTVSDIESQIQQASAGRIESVKKLEQVKHQLQSTSDEIESVKASQQELESDSTTYNDRRTKISSIYGRSVIDNPSISINAGEEIANRLRDTKRQVLRLEAQLEDADISALPALRVELETEGQRLNHLQTERHDVETSMLRTRELVSDLSSQIETKMEVGLSQINTNLERFFRILFGGGACQLKSAKDGDKRGIAITLQLPYKRIKSVHALSGGERSLASLAILFAITLLSPPPFVVLDETDAALDEANSRRYAKLVRELAEHTQLILITHNRETMTFADELYGVTMGSDGISRLLSVTLKEAQPMGKN